MAVSQVQRHARARGVTGTDRHQRRSRSMTRGPLVACGMGLSSYSNPARRAQRGAGRYSAPILKRQASCQLWTSIRSGRPSAKRARIW
jgi:hypothetical protein